MPKPKGPTWAQIGDPKLGNRIEERGCGGYTRKWSEMGKTRIQMTCPFCKTPVIAYLWSLAGGGKRCNCGALCGGDGTFYHFADRST